MKTSIKSYVYIKFFEYFYLLYCLTRLLLFELDIIINTLVLLSIGDPMIFMYPLFYTFHTVIPFIFLQHSETIFFYSYYLFNLNLSICSQLFYTRGVKMFGAGPYSTKKIWKLLIKSLKQIIAVSKICATACRTPSEHLCSTR